jgi:hypothetical protein
MSDENNQNNVDNNDNVSPERRAQIREAVARNLVTSLTNDSTPGEVIVRAGEGGGSPYGPQEHVIRPAREPDRNDTLNFITKSKTSQISLREQYANKYDSMVEKLADHLQKSKYGPNTVSMGDFEAELTSVEIGKLFTDARRLVQQRAQLEDDSKAKSRQEFEDRIREARQASCPDCGGRYNGLDLYGLDKHQETCTLFKVRVEQ